MRELKRKPVNYELIDPGSDIGRPIYQVLADLVAAHHEDLFEARIALAWCLSWKPDADGHVTIGKCKKTSDLDKEFADFDFVVLLRRTFWLDLRVTDAQRAALLDHELTHAALAYDKRGEPVLDERGRKVYRLRKHDIEEFTSIVERHGCYKRDLEQFAAALRRAPPAFQPCDRCRDDTPGWIAIIDDAGARRLTRCDCYLGWTRLHIELATEIADEVAPTTTAQQPCG